MSRVLARFVVVGLHFAKWVQLQCVIIYLVCTCVRAYHVRTSVSPFLYEDHRTSNKAVLRAHSVHIM